MKKRGLWVFEDKRLLLADGVDTLAYGLQALPPRVENEAPTGVVDGATVGLTAAEATKLRIPVRKQKYAPVCQNPNDCFPEARRARDATMQDEPVVESDPPAATAHRSTALARLNAAPPEVLFEYMWDDAI